MIDTAADDFIARWSGVAASELSDRAELRQRSVSFARFADAASRTPSSSTCSSGRSALPWRRQPLPGTHRSVQTRLLRTGGGKSSRRRPTPRFSTTPAARAQPGRAIRTSAARQRRPSAVPDRGRRRQPNRALCGIFALRCYVHTLSRSTQPPHRARRPARRQGARPLAPDLDRSAQSRSLARIRARHARGSPPGSPRWRVASNKQGIPPKAWRNS